MCVGSKPSTPAPPPALPETAQLPTEGEVEASRARQRRLRARATALGGTAGLNIPVRKSTPTVLGGAIGPATPDKKRMEQDRINSRAASALMNIGGTIGSGGI